MTAQVTLVREFLALAGGSEVVIGFVLAAWLVAGGVGSLVAIGLRPRWWLVMAAFAGLAAGYAAALWLVWGGRGFLGVSPGEILSWSRAFRFAFVVGGPPAFCVGLTFALLAAVTGRPALVYAGEAAGSAVGGFVASAVCYQFLKPVLVAGVLGVAAAAAGGLILLGRREGKFWGVAGFAVAALVGGLALLVYRDAVERAYFFERVFPGEDVVAYRVSPYGAVVASRRGERVALYENGLFVAAVPDALAAENSVHPAMLLRPHAERVVLIGGGLTGAETEFAKYPFLKEAEYLELDAALVEVSREFHPAGARESKVRYVNRDGRLWLKKAAREGYSADVIIVAVPMPVTAQLNRFYTKEFFSDVKKVLAPDGVAAFYAPGAANYYSPELSDFLSLTRAGCATAFRNVVALPGDNTIFICSDASVDVSPENYGKALTGNRIKNKFLTASYFRYLMSRDRMAGVRAATAVTAPPNADFRPAGLFYGMLVWATRVSPKEAGFLKGIRKIKLWYIYVFGVCLAIAWVGLARRARKAVVGYAVAVQGFIEIALEVVIIFCYQVVFGSAYLELAVIVGAFMAGVAVGALLPIRKPSEQLLINLLGLLAVLGFAAPVVTLAFVRWPGAPAAVVHFAFGALAFAAGGAGGAQFVVALRAWRKEAAPLLYGVDMIAAALGAVVTAGIFVPVFGIWETTAALAFLAATPIAALAVNGTTTNQPEGA